MGKRESVGFGNHQLWKMGDRYQLTSPSLWQLINQPDVDYQKISISVVRLVSFSDWFHAHP